MPPKHPFLRARPSKNEEDTEDPIDQAIQAALSAYRAGAKEELVRALLELAQDTINARFTEKTKTEE